MNVYLYDIQQAVFWFPVLAGLFTLPYLVYQYRKYGSIPWLRSAVIYALIFYLLCAYYLVILPLPPDHNTFVAYAATPQLMPFHFVSVFATHTSFIFTDPATWLGVLRNPTVYEAAFNILLTVPLGMFLRYYFHCRWWQCFLIGLATTLFFEISQITGLFGTYEHPYRLFDVDDLLLNTFGTMLGFWITGPLLNFLPDINHLNEKARLEGTYASFPRRMLAFFFDAIFIIVFAVGTLFIAQFCGFAPISPLESENAVSLSTLTGLMSAGYLIFFMLAPCLTRGQTLGQKIVKLHITHPDGSPAHFYQYFVRYGLLYLFLTIPLWFMLWTGNSAEDASLEAGSVLVFFVDHRITFAALFGALGVLWLVTIAFRAFRSSPEHPFTMLNGVMSNTRIMTDSAIADALNREAVLDVSEIARLERMIAEDDTSLPILMKRAGHTITETVRRIYPDPSPVTVFCGAGNNGGDGWVCAGELAALGYPVTLISPLIAENVTAEPARSCALEQFRQAASSNEPLRVLIDPDEKDIAALLKKSDIVIDALLGTGFSGGSLRSPLDTWIRLINEAHKENSSQRTIAIDVPSGLSAQTGKAAIPCIEADYTVTMLAYKPGLLIEEAEGFCGVLSLGHIVDIKPYLKRLDLVTTIPAI
ncbi:MAG: NAD(P)H-hydrate epimerase [Raoultibacter sp.]